MTVIHAPDVADRYCHHAQRRAAQRLVDEGTFPAADRQDVAQSLLLTVVEQLDKFDPSRARWSTFVRNVVSSAAGNLRRHQRAQRRLPRASITSLNVLIDDGDGRRVELSATVSEEEYRTRQGHGFVRHTEQVDVALDVDAAIDRLSPELQEICQRLKQQSPADVARAMGLSRNTMGRRLAALREHFSAAGLVNDD